MTDIEVLPERLLEATRKGNVPWEVSAVGDIEVRTARGGFRIAQEESRTSLLVLTPEGDVAEELVTDPSYPGPWRDWETALFELYDAARRQALGVSEILKDLAEEFNLGPLERGNGGSGAADDDIPF